MIPVEIRKVDDAGEDSEGKAPIKHEADGNVEEAAFGGSERADLDLADQTLVEDSSRGADTSEIAVSGVLLLASILSLSGFGFDLLLRFPLFFIPLLLPPRSLGRPGVVVC